MNNEFKREVVSPTEEVFTRVKNSNNERLITIAKRIDERVQMGYDSFELLNHLNLSLSERMEVEGYLKTIEKERTPKKHKIKNRKKYEEEINEEKRNVTINSIAVGATALASIVCFSIAFGSDLEFERTVSTFLLGTMSAGASVPSIKALVTSISRKARLEDSYKINYKIDEISSSMQEEKRGKNL